MRERKRDEPRADPNQVPRAPERRTKAVTEATSA